jgi:transketolase
VSINNMLRPDQRLNPKLFDDDIEMVPSRNGFGEGLVLAGEANSKVVALCADLTESTRMEAFKKKFPDRYIEVGVAEQNLATVGAGMAAAGKIPFISSYASFSPGRNWEQIRTTICYNNQPVKIVGSHAGLSVGPDGATHQALEDLALMRVLPNMVVLCPADAIEARKAAQAAAGTLQPTYLRLSRDKVPVVTTDRSPFEIGVAQVLTDGTDVTIVACGQMVHKALLAAKQLEAQGIAARVMNLSTLKPLDEKALLDAAKQAGAIVTVEEHQIIGGLGSAVAELIVTACPVPMKMIGMKDQFGESGKPEELLAKFGLTTEAIVAAVRDVIKSKKAS